MKALVVGAGALGTLLASRLASVHEVTVAAKRGGAVPEGGIFEASGDPLSKGPRKIAVSEGVPRGAFDAIFLAVKSYDAEAAMREVASLATGPVALPQNGMLHLDSARRLLGQRAVFLSVTYGATGISPGRAAFGGEGSIGVASTGGWSVQAEAVEGILSSSGFRVKRHDDPAAMVWRKTGVNCCINPLTAILGCPNGALLESEEAKRVMASVASEVEAVAAMEGLRIEGLLQDALKVCGKTAGNRSSMLQDVERGGRTEIDAISLAVASRGAAVGVRAPVNEALGELVKGLESSRLRAR